MTLHRSIRPVIGNDGQPTIETNRIVTHQQGSWKWQLRLCWATYRAKRRARGEGWIWYSVGQGGSFSGGNLRNSHTSADGSIHHLPLDARELVALATVIGGMYE